MSKVKTSSSGAVISVACDDEVDVLELLRSLWGQKWLILLGVLLGMTCALIYIKVAPQKFESRVVLVPSSITVFAPLMKDMRLESAAEGNFLGDALKLTNNAITLLGRHILAPSLQADFISSDSRFSDCTINARQNINETSKNISEVSKIIVSFACSSGSVSKLALKTYVDRASTIAAHEFQSLNSSLGIDVPIRADDLYRVESRPVTVVTPKKRNVLAMGFFLGVILGVFIALMRLTLINRVIPSA